MPETEQKHKSRKIGDLFSDYKTNSNIDFNGYKLYVNNISIN